MSVHMTMLSLPVKHEALTDISLMLSAAEPAQLEPEVIVKPPMGPQELIVVGGTAGCGCISRQPPKADATVASKKIITGCLLILHLTV